ncbi:hypothetical protein A1O1_00184 [Capronia coronata CBS 617.96]|uniref:SET domain-containing protein n=1 Tax=Capronia coronata CBS 617.96 TaxID=1182541 RepID=W9Z0H2_9EURO|nr:uncharacterized protein A1O1_00184 [Capronia coronata CBS 617.96]EXJ95066.1 hypothetical protein A1O1_00184 [Capronia coronata CBS 617.96]
MNSLSSTSSEDAILAGLLDYCAAQGISISPNISLRRVSGKGLGVYTSKPLTPGDPVMHVPTAALFTTSSVPLSFASKEARKSIPVHALLAAYLAFGMSEAKREHYARWMATWPRLTDFTSTMPVFWPGALKQPISQQRDTKRNGAQQTEEKTQFLPLPPSLTGSWLYSDKNSSGMPPKILDELGSKLESHLKTIAKAFPAQASALLSQTEPLHWKFIHMWCIVGSRCFYYLRPGQPAPKDSNEAMALCPGMDLFNHSDKPHCRTTYDRKGYEVTAVQEHGIGEEVLLGYGAHSNDLLWNEYGFIMGGDGNVSDGVQLDEVVLASLTDAQKKTLEKAGYLGDYWLKPEGLCWRSEVVSWLDVLTPGQWNRFLEGKFDPAVADRQFTAEGNGIEDSSGNRKRKRGTGGTSEEATANETAILKQTPSERAKRKQLAWIKVMASVAENSLMGLMFLAPQKTRRNGNGNSRTELLHWFGDDEKILEAQGLRGPDISKTRSSQAKARHRMCVQRWRQILQLCTHAGDMIREDTPALRNDGVNLGTERLGTEEQNIEALVDEFLEHDI